MKCPYCNTIVSDLTRRCPICNADLSGCAPEPCNVIPDEKGHCEIHETEANKDAPTEQALQNPRISHSKALLAFAAVIIANVLISVLLEFGGAYSPISSLIIVAFIVILIRYVRLIAKKK